MSRPKWEHGYRCHGYWLGLTRVGWVGLEPYRGGLGNTKDNGYTWGVVTTTGGYIEGSGRTLRAAKRQVEKVYCEINGLTRCRTANGETRAAGKQKPPRLP